MHFRKVLALALVVPFAFAAACTDTTGTTAPVAHAPPLGAVTQPPALAVLTCTASIQQRTVACVSSDEGTAGGARKVIIGGQNTYVTLASTDMQVVADTFDFGVNVTNLIPQPIGTTDGTTMDPAGVRVFFNSGPTSTTGGTITVANRDGTGTFTAAAQPYFQYNSLLQRGDVSATKRWKLQFTPEVTNFVFTVYVAAAVQFPNGYVAGTPYVLALDPGESRTLSADVRNFLGDAVLNEPVTWTSNAAGTAAVTGSQVTAGGSRGVATLTATAGARPAQYPTTVSVCQSTVVASGTSLPSSIAASDCFSSFGDPNGKPTTSYYADLYRIALTAGQTVTVTMDSGDDLDTYLLLAEGNLGTLVAGNDDDDEGTLGVGSRLVYTATTSGVYVIEASTFNGLDTGNYTLNVTTSSSALLRANIRTNVRRSSYARTTTK